MVPSSLVNFELNGERQTSTEPLTVRSLLEQLDLARRRVAVAINTEVVPKSSFDRIAIREGDRVEVIQAVGGG
jgi:thiamine biosynthesis protein ThiS